MPKILHPRGRLALAIQKAERAEILAAIKETGGDVPAAAKLLGISRRSIYTRIDALGIRREAGVEPDENAGDRR